MSERFKVVLDHARRYTSAQLYLFLPFTLYYALGSFFRGSLDRAVASDDSVCLSVCPSHFKRFKISIHIVHHTIERLF